MKKLSIVLVFMPFFAFSQKVQIESFLGIRFGECREEVAIATHAFGASPIKFEQTSEELILKDFKIAEIESSRASLSFADDRLYKGLIEFEITELNFLRIFQKLKYEISEYYGYGKDFSWFDAPYYSGTGNELEGIAAHKVKICHAWGNIKNITSDSFISLEVCGDKKLRIYFLNHKIPNLIKVEETQQLTAN